MRRPLGLWIFLSAGVLWLNTQDVQGVRASSLFFGKSSTTTTTTTVATVEEKADSSEDEANTTEGSGEAAVNGSKPVLTGIPQIDYVWDPNLPKELNGYNLSDYPFYERVPENITFKCDGLHDGFYASVLHKCQVYHHCLYGTRYDFLCANYTAFDQKTFICHFASEVDCNNSKRFWHRNDALYKADSTTTSKPLVIPTTAPPTSPATAIALADVPSGPGLGQRRVVGRPYRRRRPYYDYYDDYYDDFYYDDRPRSRGRNRPRPRPRPVYEDDYEEEYDDGSYDRRGSGGRRNESRRPYKRRPNRGRNKDRPRYDYDDEEDHSFEEADNTSRRRKPIQTNKKSNSRRRPTESKKEDKEVPKQMEETKTIVKPTSGTIYDKPRVAPKIKPPVPKNKANKYAYKSISTTAVPQKNEEYDEEYDEIKPKRMEETTKNKKGTHQAVKSVESDEPAKSNKQDKPDEDYYYDYDEDEQIHFDDKENVKDIKKMSTTTTTTTTTTTSTTTKTPPPMEITEPLPQLDEPVIIRLVKRPFLPSRGGNPYVARGLQPVGIRALTQNQESSTKVTEEISKPKFQNDFRPLPDATRNQEQFRMESTQKEYQERRVPEPSKSHSKNPLDVGVEDYDVTFNDALNPTLPNLPVRSYPTGFDLSNDYNYNNYPKTKYTSDQSAATANADYVFKTKPQRSDNSQSSRGSIREQPVQSNANYRGGFYSVIEDNYRLRQIPNTQVYYSRY